MLDIINLLREKTSLEDILLHFGKKNASVIKEYIDFLIDNELAFYLDYEEFELFPDFNPSFNIPYAITNSIIELSETTLKHIPLIATNLHTLKCKHLQIVSYDSINLSKLLELLELFKDKDFRSIELILKYSEELFENLKNIERANFSIIRVEFHSAPFSQNFEYSEKALFDVSLSPTILKDFSSCGHIHIESFPTNIKNFTESLNHNSCLHKKISVDVNGNIKNCPAMPQSFGNIKDTPLTSALAHKEFKKYWNVTKDKIAICKDCEYRYVCTDCRAHLENPEDDFSKPLKCGYNPYTNEWKDWSKNPLKQNAIEHYGIIN